MPSLEFGPFDVGLMLTADPSLLPAGAAQVATNVDISGGTLRGMYAPSTTGNTAAGVTAADLRSFAWVANDRWLPSSTSDLYACNDFDTGSNKKVSYVAVDNGTSALPPVVYRQGVAGYSALGVDQPLTNYPGSGDRVLEIATTVTGAPFVDSVYYSNPGSYAFDNDPLTAWITAVTPPSQAGLSHIGLDYNQNIIVTSVSITQVDTDYYALTSVKLQSTLDDPLVSPTWLDIDTFTLATDDSIQTFPVVGAAAARAWRILANSNTTGGTWGVTQLDFAISGGAALNINRSYALTNVTSDGWESNPIFSGYAVNAPSVLVTIPADADTAVSSRNLYMTRNGEAGGIHYLISSISGRGATNFTDSSEQDNGLNLARPLTWAIGGNSTQSLYINDNSPPAGLTMLSTALHSVTQGAGRTGGGILFGASGPELLWSRVGAVWAWPLSNHWSAPEDIRAIVTDAAQTLVFTGSALYSITGTDDQQLSVNIVSNEAGVRRGCGMTMARSRFGLLFLSTQGLTLFSGQRLSVLGKDRLPPSFWAGLADLGSGRFAGAFYGERYLLAHNNGLVVADFSEFPNVKFTTCDLAITAMHVATTEGAPSGAGLYVAKANDRLWSVPLIRAWMPERGTTRGSRLPWLWKTGRITAGRPASDKTWSSMRFRKQLTGTLAVTVRYDGTSKGTLSLEDGVGQGKDWTRLYAGRARSCEFEFSDSATVVPPITGTGTPMPGPEVPVEVVTFMVDYGEYA